MFGNKHEYNCDSIEKKTFFFIYFMFCSRLNIVCKKKLWNLLFKHTHKKKTNKQTINKTTIIKYNNKIN